MESNLVFTAPQEHQYLLDYVPDEFMREPDFDQVAACLLGGGESGVPPLADDVEEFMALSQSMQLAEDLVFYPSALEQAALGLRPTTPRSAALSPCIVPPSPSADAAEENGEEGEEEGSEYSSGTTKPTTPARMAGPGRDRGRTLVSERTRRGRMKEKLYELRSLVPNITKMDKASIIGDAIIFVEDLQRRAQILTEEIARLESSSATRCPQPSAAPPDRRSAVCGSHATASSPEKMEILQVRASEVGDRTNFFLRMECNKAAGAPAAVYRAMEALNFVRVQFSGIAAAPLSDRHAVHFALEVIPGSGVEMNASILKFWVATALMNEGFEIKADTCL